jgi:TolB-like protein
MAEGDGDGKASGDALAVFISYASQDAAIANSVVEHLEQHGLRCWLAPRDVRPGAPYADAIVRAINEAKSVVLVLSASAIGSDHVAREVERAASKHKPIIAFRIDSAALNPGLEYFLSNSQWIEVLAIGTPAALAKLAQAAGQQGQTAAADLVASARPLEQLGGRTKLIATVAVIISVSVAVALSVHFWSQSHKAVQPAAAVAISEKSVAVLPFTDMSPAKDQEYFADGIAEEVLDGLAKVPGLRVVGHSSSFRFRNQSTDSASVGAALGVAYLLEGSVHREAGRVRVGAQLIEARTGATRWSDHFDSNVTDALAVQDSIAAEIARSLQITVQADITPRASVKSPEVLDAYLRGLHSENRQSREGSDAAIADFQRALALDPAFAPAAMGLADTYILVGNEGWLPTRIVFERAREAALLAQRLDSKSLTPHVELADIHVYYDWDWIGAERELQTAFALGPRETDGVQVASQLAAARGRWDEARQLAIEAVELDPLNPSAHMILGWNVYLHTGQYAEAEESFHRGLQLAPKYGSGEYFLGEALMLEGHQDAALAEFRKETLDDGQLEGSAMALFAAGRKAESDAQLTEAIRHNGNSWPSEIARVYAFRGEKDRAFEWLNRAYELRDEDLYLIKDDPLFKNLDGDPRYKAFLQKMNLPE